MVKINVDSEQDSIEMPPCFVATTQDTDNVTAYDYTARNTTVSHTLSGTIDTDARYDNAFYFCLIVDTGSERASSGALS